MVRRRRFRLGYAARMRNDRQGENGMGSRIEIERGPSPARPSPGPFLCGAAEIDITPQPGVPLAGFSTQGQRGEGVCGHLFARVLYLRDEQGEDVAIVVVDLMSGSRLLLEKIAGRTRETCGLSVDRILLHGTHTHTGPSWFYGNSLYDFFAAKAGFDEALVDWFAGRIATAIGRAVDGAAPGGVAFGDATVWGRSRNRSLAAFRSDADWEKWTQDGPGASAPAGLHEQEQFVDPRVLALVAKHDDEAGPLAVFAFFGCHPTTRGSETPLYCSDWPGYAGRVVRAQLLSQLSNVEPIVAVGTRACGDVNGQRYGLEPFIEPGPQLEAWVGEAVGAAIAKAALDATSRTRPQELTAWFAEPRIDDTGWRHASEVVLAERWFFGAPTLTGSEETDTGWPECLVREGQTGNDFPPEHPQYPKQRFLSLGQEILKFILGLDTAPVHPLFALRIGQTLLVGLPGEPTIAMAYSIERALLEATGCSRGAVLPCCGDYGGYFATEAEYEAQHYEGSSTLYGRHSAAYLQTRLLEMVGQGPTPAVPGPVKFRTIDGDEVFRPTDRIAAGPADPQWVVRTPVHLRFRWYMPAGARVVFGNSPWVRLTELVDGTWEDVLVDGRPLDDANHPITIWRQPGNSIGREMWSAQMDLPRGLTQNPLSVVVSPRGGGFGGFVLEV